MLFSSSMNIMDLKECSRSAWNCLTDSFDRELHLLEAAVFFAKIFAGLPSTLAYTFSHACSVNKVPAVYDGV